MRNNFLFFILFAAALFSFACTSADINPGIASGDVCDTTVDTGDKCDSTGIIILFCDPNTLTWTDKKDCSLTSMTCTEVNGVAECTGGDNDGTTVPDTNKPDNTVVDKDTAVTDNITTDNAVTDNAVTDNTVTDNTVTDIDTAKPDVDTAVSDNAQTEADTTVVEADTAVVEADTVVVEADTVVEDTDITVSDDDTAVADTTADEDVIPDEDNTVCTAITPATLSYDSANKMYYAAYTPKTGDTAKDDEIHMLYTGSPNYDTPYNLGTGVNTNLATCEYCVLVGEDYDTAGKPGKIFFQSEGTFTVTQGASGCSGSDPDTATITNVKLVEVTVDGSGNSTPVSGGGCLTISSYTWDLQ